MKNIKYKDMKKEWVLLGVSVLVMVCFCIGIYKYYQSRETVVVEEEEIDANDSSQCDNDTIPVVSDDKTGDNGESGKKDGITDEKKKDSKDQAKKEKKRRDRTEKDEEKDVDFSVYFDEGSCVIHSQYQLALAKAAKRLQEDESLGVCITGYYDSSSDNVENKEIAHKRVDAIARIFVTRYRIGRSRINSRCKGKKMKEEDLMGGRCDCVYTKINLADDGI